MNSLQPNCETWSGSFHPNGEAIKSRSQRSGIILLVVLGMLTLFSVLAASFLVFSSQQRSAAFHVARAETSRPPSDEFLQSSLDRLLVGANGPESSMWGHDLLGDYYGMRDAFTGQMPATGFSGPVDQLRVPSDMLSGEFIRIPTTLYLANSATFPHRRNDTEAERQYPSSATTRFAVDDEIAGRVLTFTAGPLEGLSMRIVRYFGDHTTPSTANGREVLSGQVVLDVRPYLGQSITATLPGGQTETRTLKEWIEQHRASPGTTPLWRLFYPDDPTVSAQSPISGFFVNGRALNGPGLGWDRERDQNLLASGTFNLHETVSTSFDPTVTTSLTNANVKDTSGTGFEGSATGQDVPVPVQGHFAIYRRAPDFGATTSADAYQRDLPSGDMDEPYDAPDNQNWFLSYLPADEELGPSMASFVRPGAMHWLINQQTGGLQTLPVNRLREIVRALQRSTLRPLRITNDPTMPSTTSARAPGVMEFDYSDFTGSNSSPLGQEPIDYATTNANVLADQIRRVVRSLGGLDVDGDGVIDLDVDNNNDGIPDSVWIDAGLPLTAVGDGTVAKPMVAYLVEDLSGRVNVNLAANLAQATGKVLRTASGTLYIPGSDPVSGTLTPTDLPAGFGFGPSEIDLRPLFVSSVSVGNGPQNLITRRLVAEAANVAPAGFFRDPLTNNGNDFLGMIRQPNWPNVYSYSAAYGQPSFGLPVDKYGRGSLTLGIDGNLRITGTSATLSGAGSVAGDTFDDPYEFVADARNYPDAGFSLGAGEALIRWDDFDRDLLDQELVRLAQAHFEDPTPAMGLTAAERIAIDRDRRRFSQSVTPISNSSSINRGILPQEYRDQTNRSTSAAETQALLTSEMPSGALNAEQRNALLMQLLPQEVLAGHKLNLNRPFGNGIDDDGDGIVDEPNEHHRFVNGVDDNGNTMIDERAEVLAGLETLYRDYTNANANTIYTTQYIDLTPGEPGPEWLGSGLVNPPVGTIPLPSPQSFFARHLYVMALTLCRDNTTGSTPFDFTFGASGTLIIDPSNRTAKLQAGSVVVTTEEEELRARTLAQWAVNAADFRDPDGIMTRFDYDIDPFDGWDITTRTLTTPPPAVPIPTFRTVWGMEYPELALEESLAFHDRRVRDTDLDPTGELRFDGTSFRDNDVDQWRLPQGSLFLELRLNRGPDQVRVVASDTDNVSIPSGLPRDLYSHVDLNNNGTVDAGDEFAINLAQAAPDRNPVWRIAISNAHAGPGRPPEGGAFTGTVPSFDNLLQPVGSVTTPTPQNAFAGPDRRLVMTYDPGRPTLFSPPVTLPIERLIWFNNRNPDNGEDPSGGAGSATNPAGLGGDFTSGDNLVDFAPPDSRNIERIFYNRFANADYPYQQPQPAGFSFDPLELFVRGGQHIVIGPRALTPIGSLENHASGGLTHDNALRGRPQVPYTEYESPQRLLLTAQGFQHRLISDTLATPTVDTGGIAFASIREPVGILAAADPPTVWNGPSPIGINVSEPLPVPNGSTYYQNPTTRLRTSYAGADQYPRDTWYDYDTPGTGAFPDQPFDNRFYAELFRIFGNAGNQTGTHERFKTAYLQRLADPTAKWHPDLNPYITVDYISIDLTVFNGSDGNRQETVAGPPVVTEWIDRNNPDPFGAGGAALRERFATRYKSGQPLQTDIASATSLENLAHSVNTMPPTLTGEIPVGLLTGNHDPYFSITLNLSSNVNPDVTPSVAGSAPTQDQFPSRTLHSSTLGYSNASYGPRARQSASPTPGPLLVTGLPYNTPLTSGTWLNRPYVSPGELAWVPTTSALGFLANFGNAADAEFNTAAGSWYEGANASVGTRREINRVFPYLFNFFAQNIDFQQTPNFWRLLEWVDVPAPYDFENDFLPTDNNLLNTTPVFGNASENPVGNGGTVIDYSSLGGLSVTGNPNTWTGATAPFWINNWMEESFRAPNNVRPKDIRQGRINLNTIKSLEVYRALMESVSNASDPASGAFFNEFIASRRGYTTSTGPETGLTAGNPNRVFNQQHSSTMSGAFRPSTVSDLTEVTAIGPINPLDRTMNRPGGFIGAPGPRPLFMRNVTNVTTATDVPDSWRYRNPTIQQLPLTRLNNLATDQSNTFAVWITVGLFEVDQDNMKVGEEVGASLGQTKRYRAFHIIDRSIPVQYEPGEIHNARQTAILSTKLN